MIRTLVLGGWGMPQCVYDPIPGGAVVFDYGFFDGTEKHIALPTKEMLDGRRVEAHSLGALIAIKMIAEGAHPSELVLHMPFARFTEDGAYNGIPEREVAGMKRLLTRDPRGLLKKFYARCAGTSGNAPEVPDMLNKTALAEGLDLLMTLDARNAKAAADEVFLSVSDPLVTRDMAKSISSGKTFFVLSDSHLPYAPPAFRTAFNFNTAAQTYNENAPFQKHAADVFADFIKKHTMWKYAPDSIFEAGCGTGLVTAHLKKLFPQADISACDVSRGMLEKASAENAGTRFFAGSFTEAGHFAPEKPYSIVVSAMALQWAECLSDALLSLLSLTDEQGTLFFSIPLAGTFSSLRSAFAKANIPYPGIELPSLEDLEKTLEGLPHRNTEIECHTDVIRFQGLRDFLRTLRGSGTANASEGRTPAAALRKMIKENDAPFDAEYKYATVKLQGSQQGK